MNATIREFVTIKRSVFPVRDQVCIEVLKYLSDKSLRRAKDITRHIISLGIVTLTGEMNELQLDWFQFGISTYVYWDLRRKKLICTEGRYKHCHKFTQYRITDDGLKFLSEYDSGSSPSLISWTTPGMS
jgi:hypothetical protein